MADSLLKMSDLPSEVQEMLCAHETFRRLGFLPEEIKILYTKGEPARLHVVVQAQEKEFVFTVAEWTRTQVEFEELWNLAVHGWNHVFEESETLEIYNKSLCRRYQPELVVAMVNKGFRFDGYVPLCN